MNKDLLLSAEKGQKKGREKKMSKKDVESYFLDATVAIIKNNFDELKRQVEESPECINYADLSTGTLLHVAAYKGTPQMIEFLYNVGSDINRKENERTPIYYAALKNSIENVMKLIELGAELSSEESVGNPLFVAMGQNNLQIVKLLIDGGTDLKVQYSTRDDYWWDALSYAKYYGRTEIVSLMEEKLKEQGIEISQPEVKEEDLYSKIRKSLTRKYGKYMKKVSNQEYEVIQEMILKDFTKYLKADLKKAFLEFVESESENKPYQFSLCINPNTYDMYWWSNGNTEEIYENLKSKIKNDQDEKYYRFCPEEGCEFDNASFASSNALHEWLYELHEASEDGEIEDEDLDELCMTLIEDLSDGFIEQSYQTMLKLKEEGFFKKNSTIPLKLNFYLRETELAGADEKIAALNS